MAENLDQNLKVSERILKLRQQITALSEQETELTEDQQDLLVKHETSLAKILKFQEKRLKTALGTTQAELDLSKTFSSQTADLSSISSLYKGLTVSQTQSLNVAKQTLSSVQQSLLADETKKEILNSTLSGVTDLQTLQQKLAETGPEDLEVQQSIRDSYNSQLNQLKEALTTKLALGELTKKEAKALIKILDTQNESLVVAQKYATISSDTKDFLQSQIDAYKGIEKTIRGVLNTAKVLSSTVGGVLGGSLIAAGFAGKKLLETSRQLGGSLLSTSNISTTLFGAVFDDAVGTTKSLSKEFGGLNDVSLKTQLNTNVMAKNLGVGTSEVASMVGSFARLNEGSAETAENLIVSTRNLAQANGLVPADVMADVASSAEEFALFGKDGGKNIAEAAVAAGKLGVNMKTLSGIADNLLDFESSINAELELGAMLGKNINLDRARALAFEGDIGGMVRETLSSLGGIEEFNKMDVFSKKKTAELLGVSVEEFQKMAANADKLDKNGQIQLTQYEQMKETLGGMAEQGLTLVQSLGTGVIALGQMGGGLKTLSGPLGKAAEGFKGLFGKDALSQAQKTLSDKQISSGFGGKKAKDMLASKAGAATSKIPQTSVADKVTETTGGKGGKGMNVGNILKGAVAILILSAALFVAAKAFQEFGSVTWPAVAMGLVGLAGMAAIAYVLGKAQGEMIKGAIAVAILGAALIPFAFAMSLIAGLDMGSVIAAAAGLVIFSAAVFGLGALMSTGVGAFIFGAGLVALAGLGLAMMVLGAGLLVAGAGFEKIGGSMGSIISTISQVGSVIGGMFQYIAPIAALALALVGLAGALTLVGIAGMASLPGLLAIAAVGTIAVGVGSLLGFGGDETEGGEAGASGGNSALLEEIKGLRADLSAGKVAVYMDGQKVTSAVSKVADRIGSNSYAV